MIAVILAGGKGLRLWPESRRLHPKQLCKLVDNRTMLDHTIDRLINAGSRHIIIITSDDLLAGIKEQVNARHDDCIIEILSEPEGKNTAPAVGLVLARLYPDLTDEIIGIFPADHHIQDIAAFSTSVGRAVDAARAGHIATIGIKPDRPETGYGYIEKAFWEVGIIPEVFPVHSFREKPDHDTARSYLQAGHYMWNAGIYVGKVQTLLEEFSAYLPEIYAPLIGGLDEYLRSYAFLPSISLDYGIAEKSQRMAVVNGDFGWCDLGSWNALSALYNNDSSNNTVTGRDVVAIDSTDCLVRQKDKTVVLFGVKNLLVVETDDVILVSDRQLAQDVRSVVENLEQRERFDLL